MGVSERVSSNFNSITPPGTKFAQERLKKIVREIASNKRVGSKDDRLRRIKNAICMVNSAGLFDRLSVKPEALFPGLFREENKTCVSMRSIRQKCGEYYSDWLGTD